ncbi:MAG TPA: hypothetical protein VFN37_00165 [Candidatus Baltobacteraceae bacterium]|nr:hypothetical protein [Candidatus Baltobacteraceae bacterium]
MKAPWLWPLALIFGARYAVSAWFEPLHDSDLAWQQWLGQFILAHGTLPSMLGPEAFAAQGAPWIPQEWALSLLVSFALGTPWFGLLAIGMALAAVGVLVITAQTARRTGSSQTAVAICGIAVGLSLVQSFGVRAQVLGWLMLAVFMLLLRTAPARTQWWIVPLTVLWANLHASVMLAPALLAIWTAGVALEERAWNTRVRHHVLLTAAAALAVCANPLGIRMPLYALALFNSPIRHVIDEWQPTTIGFFAFSGGVLPLILLMSVLGFEEPRRWSEIFTFAAAAVLSLTAARNVPIASILIAPLAAQRLNSVLPARLEVGAMTRRAEQIAFHALALAGSFAVVLLLAREPTFARSSVPLAAITAASTVPGTHHLYCEDFAWCSWALAHRNLRTFIDGRCDPFPASIWKQYLAVYEVKPRWNAILNGQRIDLVLAKRTRPLAQALRLTGRWREIYTDSTYALFIRRRG